MAIEHTRSNRIGGILSSKLERMVANSGVMGAQVQYLVVAHIFDVFIEELRYCQRDDLMKSRG